MYDENYRRGNWSVGGRYLVEAGYFMSDSADLVHG